MVWRQLALGQCKTNPLIYSKPKIKNQGAVVLVESEDVVKNGIGVLDKEGPWTSGQRGKKSE